jgi:aspartyl-tRNA(Asn)/glutamyl-tRNA(Gln) amidotransferase subunit A
MDLASLTLSEAIELIGRREVSPVELTRGYLERIDRLDGRLNSYITVTRDSALAAAEAAQRSLERGEKIGPLHGIPLALKDLYETAGIRTTMGSLFFTDYVPQEDAVAVSKLYSAGALLLGKLNMHEIALGVTNINPHYGPCRNPWDTRRITGGSSGGSGAALAAGLCLGSLGSDTGGSVRIPASLCGVVGLKPTYGRVSLHGVLPLSWNLDHAGPMGHCVRDVTLLLGVIAGHDPLDPYSAEVPSQDYLVDLEAGVSGWRVALASDEYFSQVDEEVGEAVREAGRLFERMGAHVEAAAFPGARDAARANGLMTPSDGAAYHRQRLQDEPHRFGADVLSRLEKGRDYTSTEYILARRDQTILRHRFMRFFQDYDLMLTPTTPVVAELIAGTDSAEKAAPLTRFTAPFNLTGLPALSVPCGFTADGLPIGLQLVSGPWKEAALLRAGYAYESAAQWRRRRPLLN